MTLLARIAHKSLSPKYDVGKRVFTSVLLVVSWQQGKEVS
jgi:hypothetical protein